MTGFILNVIYSRLCTRLCNTDKRVITLDVPSKIQFNKPYRFRTFFRSCSRCKRILSKLPACRICFLLDLPRRQLVPVPTPPATRNLNRTCRYRQIENLDLPRELSTISQKRSRRKSFFSAGLSELNVDVQFGEHE